MKFLSPLPEARTVIFHRLDGWYIMYAVVSGIRPSTHPCAYQDSLFLYEAEGRWGIFLETRLVFKRNRKITNIFPVVMCREPGTVKSPPQPYKGCVALHTWHAISVWLKPAFTRTCPPSSNFSAYNLKYGSVEFIHPKTISCEWISTSH